MLYHCDDLTFRIISVARIVNHKGTPSVKGRPFHSLVYRVRGSAKFLYGTGERLLSCPNDVSFCGEGADYEVQYTDGETIAVHFVSDDYHATAENYALKDPSHIYDLFCDILEKWQNKECPYTINAAFYRLLAELRRLESAGGRQDAFYNAIEYIGAHFQDAQLCLADVCKSCGISEANFRLKCKKIYGESPIRYLTRLRISHAIRLLALGGKTIESIATESGFFDPKYFARIIKKQYGIAPMKLAKKITM